MSVYVDNYFAIYGRMKMSHMIADSRAELYAMVDRLGVQRKWIQSIDTYAEHFDICQSNRDLAIKFGAIPITIKEFGLKIRERRQCLSRAKIQP